MKVLLIGAAGDIGKAACAALGDRHDIITVGRSGGQIQCDVSDQAQVRTLYERVGSVDAVVSCAGDASFAPLTDLDQERFMVGLRQKVMGQVNLVLVGLDYVADRGSFTLTSGVLDRDPIPKGVNAATANGALAGFVTGAAIEMPRGLRINVVSPDLLDVSVPRYGKLFPGHKPVASLEVGRAYQRCVEGRQTGQVVIVS